MKISQLATTGIILTLLTSNIIITHQYAKESKEYEKQLDYQTKISSFRQELIGEKTAKINVLREVIQDKDAQIETKQNEIHKLKKQLQNAMNNSESPMPSVSRGSTNSPKIYMIATAYISRCYGCSGITKVGINVRNNIEHNGLRIIAVDPNIIPLHSLVKVYTKKETFLAYAGDTGGAIKGNKIDVLIDTHSEQKAFEFGKQDVVVQIIREGKG